MGTNLIFFIDLIVDFLNSLIFILILLLCIIAYHILLFFTKNKKYIQNLKKFNDPKEIKLTDLNRIPLVNIIVPAWKEGDSFELTLLNITTLTYPKLKVIINAGGSDYTNQIANKFKKFDNFTILHQKQGGGKLKAINECLNNVTNGIVCILDSDILITDINLLYMIHPLINGEEDVVIAPLMPHTSIINSDLVKYLYINRYSKFKHKFKRHSNGFAANVCMKYDVIKSLGGFSEKNKGDDSRATGRDLSSKGYKVFNLCDHKIQSLTYPNNIRKFLKQNLRWIENNFYHSIKNKKSQILKFVILTIISLYIVISPFFLYFNLNLFLIGILLLSNTYLKRIRKIIFFKLVNKDALIKIRMIFYLKLIFFTYLDIIVNLIVFFEIIFYRKAYKRRKNLLN